MMCSRSGGSAFIHRSTNIKFMFFKIFLSHKRFFNRVGSCSYRRNMQTEVKKLVCNYLICKSDWESDNRPFWWFSCFIAAQEEGICLWKMVSNSLRYELFCDSTLEKWPNELVDRCWPSMQQRVRSKNILSCLWCVKKYKKKNREEKRAVAVDLSLKVNSWLWKQ